MNQLKKRISKSTDSIIRSMKEFTEELVRYQENTIPHQKEEWIETFELYYGDLIDDELWKESLKSLGYPSDNDECVLFCMYTSYALTIRGIMNCILCNNESHSKKYTTIDMFSYTPLEDLNIIPTSKITLFDWPLLTNDDIVLKSLDNLLSAVAKCDLDSLQISVNSNWPFSKVIFKSFFPKRVRHHLGEYYTPKWLAEMTIDELLHDFKTITNRKFLDPSCGCGAFLVELISRFKEADMAISDICEKIVGIDINPTAVIASQCNYVLSLLNYTKDVYSIFIPIHIPIYHGDSMLSPKVEMGDNIFSIATSHGRINYTVKYSDNCEFQLDYNHKINTKSLEKYLTSQHKLTTIGKFTDLIGNPPWISWEHISPKYKKKMEATFLEEYHMYNKSGNESLLGMGHDDICVAFLYICADRFLEDCGNISMLLKQSIYQGQAHGIFRELSIKKPGKQRDVNLKKVIDLSLGDPFESPGAATSISYLVIDEKTTFPIPYTRYHLNEIKGSHVDLMLNEVLNLPKEELILNKDENSNISEPWVLYEKGARFLSVGSNSYSIRHGYVNDLVSVYFIDVEGEVGNNLIIQPSNNGHQKVYKKHFEVERDSLYPVLKARHVKKWSIVDHEIAVVPQKDYKEDNEEHLKLHNPKLYKYLETYKKELLSRSSIHIREKPFYSTFGIGDYTFSKYKVFFNAMGSLKQSFCVGTTCNSKFLGEKVYVPHNNINCISTESIEEAHFVCGVLNSDWVSKFVRQRGGKSKYPWSTKMMKGIPIPKYNCKNEKHIKISNISKQIHNLVAKGKPISIYEQELNQIVSEIL